MFTVLALGAKFVVTTVYERELIELSNETISQLILLPPKTEQSQRIFILDEGIEVSVYDLTSRGVATITLNGTMSSYKDLFYRYREEEEEQQFKLVSKLWLTVVKERIKDQRTTELIDFAIEKINKKEKGTNRDPRHAYGTLTQKDFDPAKEADGLRRISISSMEIPRIIWFFDTSKVLSRLSPFGSAIHSSKGYYVWWVGPPWTYEFFYTEYRGIRYALSNLAYGIWLPILITAGLTLWFRKKGILLFVLLLPVMFITYGLAVQLAILLR